MNRTPRWDPLAALLLVLIVPTPRGSWPVALETKGSDPLFGLHAIPLLCKAVWFGGVGH